VISEVQCLVRERVQVDLPPFAAAAARMREHARDDAVGAPPVLGDFCEIAAQGRDDLVDLGAHIVAERRDDGCRRLLELVQ
jgi:hypothetical protein